VLPKAMALLSNQGSQVDEARDFPAYCNFGWHEPKRSMETFTHIGHPIGHDQSMAQGSRFAFCQRSMGNHPLPGYGSVAHGKHLVRTRTPGGVGAGGEILPATRLENISLRISIFQQVS
jgi:hypothetical protein